MLPKNPYRGNASRYISLCRRGRWYYDEGRMQEAIDEFTISISFYPECSFAQYRLSCCYALINEPENALNHFEKALELDSQRVISEAVNDAALDNIKASKKFMILMEEYGNSETKQDGSAIEIRN